MTRLDGPGGQLALSANYAKETQILALDFSLNEPADGIVANVLGIEGGRRWRWPCKARARLPNSIWR